MSAALEMTARRLRVALCGNPNTGKTSLFNLLSGSRAKVGNYPGVTVERRTATCLLPSGQHLTLIDVPGCYSLTARSPEEEVAHDALVGGLGDPPPDVVVVVVDAANLARNLYLTLQIAELGRPIVLALNMMDVAREDGTAIDVPRLSRALGLPVAPIVATTGEGIGALGTLVSEAALAGAPPPRHLELAEPDRAIVDRVQAALARHGRPASPGEALWLLTSSPKYLQALPSAAREDVVRERAAADHPGELDFNRRVITSRYAYIDRVVAECATFAASTGPDRTERIDRVLTHPVWGMAIFVATMTLLFQSVFTWADPLIGLIEDGMASLSGAVARVLPDGILRELVVDGVIAGVGNILVFLPQIVMLFLAIALLEDSGYMARAAFLLDRMMRRVGLHGKAFVPLLSSFACAIPGIMAARTIEGRRDRIVTILVAPLMSCSARLPVYTMVIGTVFASTPPVFGVLSAGGLIITAMYFLGIMAAFGMAWVFKNTLLRAPTPPLIMELPSYKRPVAKDVLREMGSRARIFVMTTGRTILALSIILWALMAYPRTTFQAGERDLRTAAHVAAGMADDEAARAVDSEEAQHRLQESFAGTLGHAIEPLIAPLGFDWKIGIGLIGSFAAREVLVSTLGQVYGVGSDVDEDSVVLREAILADVDPATGRPRFSPLVGLSLMVFFVLAMQCLSTVAVVRRETASWRWPILLIVYMNALAWIGAFVTHTVGTMLGYA